MAAPRTLLLERLALAGAWAICFWPVLRWLGAMFSGEAFRLNLALFAGVAVLVIARARARRPWISPRPVWRVVPVGLLLASLGAYVGIERALDVNIASAVAFGGATFALIGLFVSPSAWRAAAVPALLLVAVLPFGEQANTYLGFAARVVTARVVEGVLELAGIASIGSDTILMFESGVAYVDVPCSGIKSLWTGAVFFLAATFVERRAIDARWLASAMIFAGFLFAANIFRVTVIVLLVARGEEHAAELLHEPLGLFAFAVACAAAVLLLKFGGREHKEAEPTAVRATPSSSWAPAAALIAAFLLRGTAADSSAPLPAGFIFPEELATSSIPLTEAERGLFERAGGTTAEKRRFSLGEISGTLLVVSTTRWRAHHPPEICLAASGVRVEGLETVVLGPQQEIRTASVDGGKRTALYWYQSPDRATGDLLDRIWADIRGGERRWVLISIMLDRPVSRAELERIFQLMSGVNKESRFS